MVIPKSHEGWQNDKQLINYREHRVRFLSWMWNVGKDPESATGYSEYTVYGTAYRSARFDKWRWERFSGYSMPPTEDETKAFIERFAFDYDQSETAKSKLQEGFGDTTRGLITTRTSTTGCPLRPDGIPLSGWLTRWNSDDAFVLIDDYFYIAHFQSYWDFNLLFSTIV